MSEVKESAEIKSINELLKMKLVVPNYQRPYKWTTKNVADLLDDICSATEHYEQYAKTQDVYDYKYRIGTIILHWNQRNKVYDIVDGQQRVITLLLLRRYLTNESKTAKFIKLDLTRRETQANLVANYSFIKDWFSLRLSSKGPTLKAFSDLLEVVVITVEQTSEAFQLFDSQNSRGRELDPHDLLKAYHLREMKGYLFEMQRAVTKWEAVAPADIKELFSKFLFPIIKWSDRDRSTPFTAQEIETFKGIPETSEYSYATRARKSMPSFQITESFIAGNDFFTMVDYYLALLHYLRSTLRENEAFFGLVSVLDDVEMIKSVGFKYARTLFECTLLSYYDRFRNLDERAVKKLFTWAFMLRVDMENLGFDSVNRYAIGIEGGYTNTYPMFSIIAHARVHTAISNLVIQVVREPDAAKSSKWDRLYSILKKMNQV